MDEIEKIFYRIFLKNIKICLLLSISIIIIVKINIEIISILVLYIVYKIYKKI
jgi:hypothetical protein